jgi:CBS domain-containing protein
MNDTQNLEVPIQPLMTTVPAVTVDDSVETAIRVFQSSPLKILTVTKDGKLAGMITANDMTKLYELGPTQGAKVSQLATLENVVAIKSNAEVWQLLKIMNGGNPRGQWLNEIPVVDNEFRPVGIVTRDALVRNLP